MHRLSAFWILVACVASMASTACGQSASGAAGEELNFTVSMQGTEGAVPLPRPTGIHSVGTRTIHWILDELEVLSPNPWDHREVIAQLFYPAVQTGSGPPAPYIPELPLLRRGLLTHGFPPFAELAARLSEYQKVQTSAWLGAPASVEDGPFPLVLVSPGGNMSRHWHTALAQELSSHGFVVGVISHPQSGLDVFPGAGFQASNLRWHPGDDVPALEVQERDQRLAERLAEDASAVLDGLQGTVVSDLGITVDGGRVAILGHSRGGSTVTTLCRTDLRIDVCVILDNLGAVSGFDNRISQPRLFLRTEWAEHRSERLRKILEGSTADAFDVVIHGADHFSFSDLPLVDPESYPSKDIAPETAHALVSHLTLAFLDSYLRAGKTSFTESVLDLKGRVRLTAY